MEPRAGSITATGPEGEVRLAFLDWGRPDSSRTVVCVHGLARQAHDFDPLARALCDSFRVIALDVAGRGGSGWLADKGGYGYETYLRHLDAVLAGLGLDAVDWIGTSMGGLIGMLAAARPGSPVRRLVINDIGPFIPRAALERIGAYVGETQIFPTVAAAEAWLRRIYQSFGALSDADWADLTRHSIVPADGGGWRPHYDPAIALPFQGPQQDVDLWAVYDAIACPVLVLRGAESDLLLADTAAAMTRRGPRAELVEIPGCGHAPALRDPAQIAIIGRWLNG